MKQILSQAAHERGEDVSHSSEDQELEVRAWKLSPREGFLSVSWTELPEGLSEALCGFSGWSTNYIHVNGTSG